MVEEKDYIKDDKNPTIISFGSGGSAKLIQEIDCEYDNEPAVKFRIEPFKDYKHIYQPQLKDFKNGNELYLKIPKKYIVRENLSPQTPRVKVLCNPDCSKTKYTELHKSLFVKLQDRDDFIVTLEKEIELLKNEINDIKESSSFKVEMQSMMESVLRNVMNEILSRGK